MATAVSGHEQIYGVAINAFPDHGEARANRHTGSPSATTLPRTICRCLPLPSLASEPLPCQKHDPTGRLKHRSYSLSWHGGACDGIEGIQEGTMSCLPEVDRMMGRLIDSVTSEDADVRPRAAASPSTDSGSMMTSRIKTVPRPGGVRRTVLRASYDVHREAAQTLEADDRQTGGWRIPQRTKRASPVRLPQASLNCLLRMHIASRGATPRVQRSSR